MAASSSNAQLVLCWVILCGLCWGQTPGSTSCERIKPCSCTGRRVVCKDQRLTRIPLGIPSDITSLDLSNNNIEHIDTQRLLKFKSLKELILHHNKIKKLPPWDLFPTTLTVLSLEKPISQDSFIKGLQNIERELQHHNKITAVPSFNTTKQHSLRKLYLNSNKIRTVGINAFANLTKLKFLKLNRNKFTAIPLALSRLNSLTNLDLSRNNIKFVSNSLKTLVLLRTLKLSKNQISGVQSGAFWGLDKLEQIYFDRNNFSSLQTIWFFGLRSLQELFFQDNHISQIQINNVADWRSFPVLRKLNLGGNKLSHITDQTFKHLLALKYLNVASNRIYHTTRGAFSDLNLLETLDLSNNDISWTVEEMNGLFSGLRNLVFLRLDGNRITAISENAFLGLENLRFLNLSANIITSVQENAFRVLTSLDKLWLNTTHLMCDCKIKWLPEWFKSQKISLTTVQARCLHPQHLNMKSVFNVTPSAFICDTSNPVPQISRHPSSQHVLKGKNVTLRCQVQVFQKNNSGVKLSWRHDRDVMKTGSITNHAQISDANMVMYTSDLKLARVGLNDAGFYQCLAHSKFGSASSMRAKLDVFQLPSFTKKPEDVTVQAGDTIRLPCAAQGEPKPTISWRKDEGDTKFAAAEERRIIHHESEDLFLITDSKAKDTGYYTCSARNDAGSINATVFVTVLEVPRFMQAMTSKTVKEDESVVLECIASGIPKPRFRWYKDDRALSLNARVLTHLNGQLLVIVRVELDDEGTYMCEVSNSLGTARQSAELTVLTGTLHGGQKDEKKEKSAFRYDKKTFLAIIVIVVVSCVLGTSLVWLLVIYCARRGSHKRRKHEELHATAAPREDVSYIPLKSYSSGSTQTSRDSPRSTATFTTSTGSQGSAFPPSTASSETNSGSEKALTADNLSSETSVKGSHSSLASSCPSDASEPVRQVIHVQIHSSDSDSEKCKSVSPARRKGTSSTRDKNRTIHCQCGQPCGMNIKCACGISNEISEETELDGLLTEECNTSHV